MPNLREAAIAAVLGLGLAAPAPLVLAQEAPAPSVTQAQTFSEEKLESFVEAAAAVQDVRWRYEQEIATMASPEERQRLAAEGEEEMVSVIDETEGIDFEEYNAIFEAAMADPQLAQRLNEQLARTQ